MPAKPATIDEYLVSLSDEQREALERIRKAIHAVVPTAEECISYGLPTFRFDGRMLVSFGASPKHCAFYPLNSTTVKELENDLQKYETSAGTIRFQPDRPLTLALVRKIVKIRLTENAAANDKLKAKKRPTTRK